MQPALGVGDHGHRVLGAADDEPGVLDGLDQGFDLGGFGDHVLQVGAQGEVDEAVPELLADLAQLAQGEDVQDALGADLDGPDLVPAVGDVAQDAGARVLVVFPHAEVLAHHGMHVLPGVGTPGFDRLAHVCHRLSSKNASKSLDAVRFAAPPGRNRATPRLGWISQPRRGARTRPRRPRPSHPCGCRNSGAGG